MDRGRDINHTCEGAGWKRVYAGKADGHLLQNAQNLHSLPLPIGVIKQAG